MAEAQLQDAHAMAQAGARAFPNDSDAYRRARAELLAEEIELRRHLERVAALRRALPPGGEVAARYRFVGVEGETDMAGLFGDKPTLITYSFMFGPERARPCPMCTNFVGAVEGNAADLQQRVAYAVIARSPVARFQAFARERGWRETPLYEDATGAFSEDYHARSPAGDDVPALNVFTRKDGVIRHFWGGEMSQADPRQDPRGAPDLAPLWNLLDLTPEGRGADWYPKLSY